MVLRFVSHSTYILFYVFTSFYIWQHVPINVNCILYDYFVCINFRFLKRLIAQAVQFNDLKCTQLKGDNILIEYPLCSKASSVIFASKEYSCWSGAIHTIILVILPERVCACVRVSFCCCQILFSYQDPINIYSFPVLVCQYSLLTSWIELTYLHPDRACFICKYYNDYYDRGIQMFQGNLREISDCTWSLGVGKGFAKCLCLGEGKL